MRVSTSSVLKPISIDFLGVGDGISCDASQTGVYGDFPAAD